MPSLVETLGSIEPVRKLLKKMRQPRIELGANVFSFFFSSPSSFFFSEALGNIDFTTKPLAQPLTLLVLFL